MILSIQDTSDIKYTNLKATTGLGDFGGGENSRGLNVHSTIAVTPNGVMKGILDQKIWTCDPAERGKRITRHQIPIEEKENFNYYDFQSRVF